MGIDPDITAVQTAGFTLQVYVPTGDTAEVRSFYSSLFGREPEFEPHDDFFEWAPIAGQECWFQVSGKNQASPLLNRVRFRVQDLGEALSFLDSFEIEHSEPPQLPGVVAFVDFADHWGNSSATTRTWCQVGNSRNTEAPRSTMKRSSLGSRTSS
ncbi:hypothetical protein [Brevibacterium permense]|uniref:hypothetical protein n=1 Tax=Brevibacterium permense TaxID=234834 RepID=UPI0021D15FC7|nr:hypothetical protein [Brevibacterium permense]